MYYQPRTPKDKPFPVRDDFFPSPLLLSAERLAELRAQAAKELAKTLQECAVYTSARGTYLVNSPLWRAHAEADGLSEYKYTYKALPNTSDSRIFGTVNGNYHDLAQFFHSETRADYFNVQKKLFSYTLDAAVLYTVPTQADASPLAYEGVKWAVYEPFSLRFRMDTCHFESMGTGIDAQGKPYAYRVLLPAAFPEVPDLFKTKRTMRMLTTSVAIFMPSERNPNATELFMAMHNDFKSNSVPRSLYKRYMMNLHRIHSHMDNRRTANRYVLTRSEWVPEHQRNSECSVCTRQFSMLRSKRHCYMCGEVVCRKCLVKSSDVLQVKPVRRDEAASSRVCTPCIKLLREDHEHAMTTPMVGDADGDIWTKSPNIHEPLRMSETPTEMSNGEIAASFRSLNRISTSGSTTSSSGQDYVDLRSSQSDWTTTPTSASILNSRESSSRFSFSDAHRLSTSSYTSDHSSSSNHRHSMVSLTSPIAVVGAPNEQIEYIDDEDVIYEEDPELLSQRSAAGVEITLDTSDMERVRGVSSLDTSDVERVRGVSTASSAFSRSSSRAASVASEEVFQSITSSLHEQEQLLRQLQAAASLVRRDTRSASGAVSAP